MWTNLLRFLTSLRSFLARAQSFRSSGVRLYRSEATNSRPVPFRYEAPAPHALRQGEILGPVWTHRIPRPAHRLPDGDTHPVESEEHPLMIVLHADCDLERDYEQRDSSSGQLRPEQKPMGVLPGVILCDLFFDADIRPRLAPGREEHRRASQNQNERFHHLSPAGIEGGGEGLPDLYLDFKRTLIEPPEAIYGAIISGGIHRVAIVPPPYLQDLTHRFFGFHSRVGLPDD